MSARRLSVVEQQMNRCRHFTGVSNPACAAGVRYIDVMAQDESLRGLRKWPCFADEGGPLPCDKRSFPTREEAEESERAFAREMEYMATARKRITEKLGPYKRGVSPNASGTVECPKCNGKLHFTRAAYNGHVHARCATGGCLCWME